MKAYNSEFEQDSFWNWNRRSFNNSSRRIVSHFFILASRNSIRKSYECVVNQFLVSRRISVFRDYKILAPSFLRMASSYLQTHDFLNGTENCIQSYIPTTKRRFLPVIFQTFVSPFCNIAGKIHKGNLFFRQLHTN